MNSHDHPATRLADALFVASIVITGTLGEETSPDTIIALMQNAFDELIRTYGDGSVELAAEIIELGFKRLCSEIFIEP